MAFDRPLLLTLVNNAADIAQPRSGLNRGVEVA